jgi:hypothetical protein
MAGEEPPVSETDVLRAKSESPVMTGRHLIHVNPGDLHAWFEDHLRFDA